MQAKAQQASAEATLRTAMLSLQACHRPARPVRHVAGRTGYGDVVAGCRPGECRCSGCRRCVRPVQH